MYCRYCGKEISDEAFMCPNCGTPTGTAPSKKKVQNAAPETSAGGVNATALSVVAFILSMIAFVTGIIFGAFFYVYTGGVLLLYVLGTITILPALAGLSIGTYLLCSGRNQNTYGTKVLATISVIYSALVLTFLLITACLIVTEAIY